MTESDLAAATGDAGSSKASSGDGSSGEGGSESGGESSEAGSRGETTRRSQRPRNGGPARHASPLQGGGSSHLRDLDSSVLEDGLSLSEAASTVSFAGSTSPARALFATKSAQAAAAAVLESSPHCKRGGKRKAGCAGREDSSDFAEAASVLGWSSAQDDGYNDTGSETSVARHDSKRAKPIESM